MSQATLPTASAARRAFVLFSGGQDSTVCLAWALQRNAHVGTVGFDYGQRHAIELTQRLVVIDEIRRDFEIAIETNGTITVHEEIDWICVNPKSGAQLRQLTGNELKVVVPQHGQNLDEPVVLNFDLHLLQPMDGPLRRENTRWAIDACLRDPRWRLITQAHEILGIR